MERAPQGDPFSWVIHDPHVWACACKWHGYLKRQGISDTDAGDLVDEAWINARPRFASGAVDNPVAYMKTCVRSAALGRMRRHRQQATYATDPHDGAIAWRADDDQSFEEVETVLRLRQTLQFLDREQREISARLVRRLGEPERPEAVWKAAVTAAATLLSGSGRQDGMRAWSVREVLSWSMTRSDSFFAAEQGERESRGTALDRRRKRVARDLPWVSFIAVWEALSFAYSDDPYMLRMIARRHYETLGILHREWRNHPDRSTPLEQHLDEVRRAMGDDNPLG